MSKQRLDMRVAHEYPQYSRSYIRSLIMQGKVLVNEYPVMKAGTQVKDGDVIRIKHIDDQYVCRSGWKLSHALDVFNITIRGKTVLDAGISTGGFTDCLLQNGAAKVYGVDVGYGQVHDTVRHDPRVILLERTNLRHLTQLDELVDIVTLDLSFISVLKVMKTVTNMLRPHGELVVLIKPQFEVGKHEVPKGGIIRDQHTQDRIVAGVLDGIRAYKYTIQGVSPSPIQGAKGNQEYVAYCIKGEDAKEAISTG